MATLLVSATPADGVSRLVPYMVVRHLNDSKQRESGQDLQADRDSPALLSEGAWITRYSDNGPEHVLRPRGWPEVALGEALQSGDGGVIVISSQAVSGQYATRRRYIQVLPTTSLRDRVNAHAASISVIDLTHTDRPLSSSFHQM